MSFRKILSKGVGYLLGCNIRFWFNVWVGKASLCVLYSKVFRVASNKSFRLKIVYVVEGSVSWEVIEESCIPWS